KIKETIRTGGVLQVMIVASDERAADADTVYAPARLQAERAGEERVRSRAGEDRRRRDVLVAGGRQVGFWARLAREEGDPKPAPLRAVETILNGYVRDARTGEILDLNPQQKRLFASSPSSLDAYLKERGI